MERVLYLMLGAFPVEDLKFVSVAGGWRITAAMGLAMELPVVVLSLIAGLVSSCEQPTAQKKRIIEAHGDPLHRLDRV